MMSKYIQEKRDEEGFTLIELLVVVIIIGILAAIAIPVFLNQRENAWRSAAESDVRNAAVALESVYTSTDAYPADNAAFRALEADGTVQESNNVTMSYVLGTGDEAGTFVINADHSEITDSPVATYNSGAGGLQNLG